MVRRRFLQLLVAMLPLAMAPSALAQPPYPDDPLQSPMWTAHARLIFGDDPVRFDPRIQLLYPQVAENQRSFPVALDARGVGPVTRMVIFADLNPIPIAIDYRPDLAEPYIATRIKLDQRTPVRGAVQLASGQWLVAGGWVDAAGGGCSAPPVVASQAIGRLIWARCGGKPGPWGRRAAAVCASPSDIRWIRGWWPISPLMRSKR